jgi:hypothetical protein
MSNYDRTTRECAVSQLRPELRQAIWKYFQEHKWGDPEAEVVMCCETTSERKSAGKLASLMNDDPDAIVHTGMLLTSQWLIWARRGDQSGMIVTAANLKDIRVKAFASRLTKDTGLEVSGYIGDSKGRIRGYLGMGPELAAQKFCDLVQQAILKANPPTKKRLPRWLTGWQPPSQPPE